MFEEGADNSAAQVACSNLVALFEASLRLLHPVMPFITEEIWHAIYDGKPPLKSIALAAFPQSDPKQIDLKSETHMAVLQDLIVSVRNLRAEMKVEPKVKVPIQVYAHEPEIRALIEQNRGAILSDRQANVESIAFVESSLAKLPGARAHRAVRRAPGVRTEDRRGCRMRTSEKGAGEAREGHCRAADANSGNEGFLSKAPAERGGGPSQAVQRERSPAREGTASAKS